MSDDTHRTSSTNTTSSAHDAATQPSSHSPQSSSPSSDDRTYIFGLGTSGIIGTAIIRVTATDTPPYSERRITQVIFRKALVFKGQRKGGEEDVPWASASKVWKQSQHAKFTNETLSQHIERLTQAQFVTR